MKFYVWAVLSCLCGAFLTMCMMNLFFILVVGKIICIELMFFVKSAILLLSKSAEPDDVIFEEFTSKSPESLRKSVLLIFW